MQTGKRSLPKHLKKSTDDELPLNFNDLNKDDVPVYDIGDSNRLVPQSLTHTVPVTEMETSDSAVSGAAHADSASSISAKISKSSIETQDGKDSVHSEKQDNPMHHLIHKKDVTEHPLMLGKESSEEEDVEEYTITKKRSQPPPRPPKPNPPVSDTTHEKVGAKSMISSVIFDPKARTQLFSSLKRNLQQYTNSTGTAEDDSTKYSAAKSVAVNKGIRQRAMEPWSVIKRLQEQPPKDEDAKDQRIRSSSENNIRGIHSKPLTDGKSSSGDLESLDIHGVRRSPAGTVMSLSSLLADRQESITGSIHTRSDEDLHVHEKPINNVKRSRQKSVKLPPPLDNSPKIKTCPVSKQAHVEKGREEPISLFSLYILAIPIYLFNILPLPFSIRIAVLAFFMGGILATVTICLIVSPRKQIQSFKPPYVTRTVPYRVPKLFLNTNETYKGWMNQIFEYDTETYHIASTISVFVTLEGSTLRLQTPRRNVSKRAIHGEKTIQPTDVIQSRVYSLHDAKVYLIPYDLVKKRVWSKKYPICIEILQPKPELDLQSESCSEQGIDEEVRVCKEKIYLFGRTLPEKERWFYRFQRAITVSQQEVERERSSSIEKSLEELDDEFEIIDDLQDVAIDPVKLYRNYFVYMCRLLPDPDLYARNVQSAAPLKPVIDYDQQMIQFSSLANEDALQDVITTQPGSMIKSPDGSEPTLEVAWFNVVVGRVMFDFFRLQKWADWVTAKIQKKLEKIRLPYFMEGLRLTAIDLGKTVPLVHKISLPRMDAQGIWLDMDITYNGSVQMTLETKLVLTRLGKKEEKDAKLEPRVSAALNSEEEDSAESSDDDESIITQVLPQSVQHLVPKGSENSPMPKHKGPFKDSLSLKKSTQGTPSQEKKWMRVMDTITKSKYFKKVAENAYVKKKFETVSNTPLILTAELNQCTGTVCLNIPPPPSDRIWYGFKEPPEMTIKAKPKLGERVVTVTPITDWIEKKLGQEFNKVFVLPNMDDIPIPIMFNNLKKQSQ